MKQIPATRLFLLAFAALLVLGGLGLSAEAKATNSDDVWALICFVAAAALVIMAFVGRRKS